MTCADMGGPASCSVVISGETPEEMIANGMKHLNKAHPDMLADMKAMPKEDGDKWRAEFMKKWEMTPDA